MEGTAWTWPGECWPCMAACAPFSVAAPRVVLWEPGFSLTCRAHVVLPSSSSCRLERRPQAQSVSHSECFFLTLQTAEMPWEQARLKRPRPKILAELTEKAVYFRFILNLGCLIIQHISGASGSHFVSGKGNMLKNKASAEGSGVKRRRRFLTRLFST